MFRGERPARGRYRQFYQLGAECIGDAGPGCDAEMIDALVGFLQDIGIAAPDVFINSIGSGDTRARYKDALAAALDAAEGQALAPTRSDGSRRTRSASSTRSTPPMPRRSRTRPTILDFLTDADRAHWDELRRQPRRARHAVQDRPEARPRARLLHAHARSRSKARYDKLRRGQHSPRRRPLRRHGEGPRRPGDPGDRLRRRPRAPASSPAPSRSSASVVDVFVAPLGEGTQARGARSRA